MKKKIRPAIICFLIGLAFIQFFGINGLKKLEKTASWLKLDATVLSSEVALSSDELSYDLSIKFRGTVHENVHTYSIVRNSGSKDQMDKLAETVYAAGATIPVLINPKNPTEYRFPLPTRNPWLLGFLPGAVLMLLGFSVLRKNPAGAKSKN